MSEFNLNKMTTTLNNLSAALDIMLCCKDANGGQEVVECCEELNHLVVSLDGQINVFKEAVVQKKSALQSAFQRQLEELKSFDERCSHMIVNFPFNSSDADEVETQQYNRHHEINNEYYRGNYSNNVTNNTSNVSSASKWSDNCWPSESAVNRTMSNSIMNNNTVFGRSISSQAIKQQVPFLKSVDNSEMDTVPKYMKGRLTSLHVNVVIDGINAALENKYEILQKPRNALKKKDLDMYNTWKIQQNSVGSSQFFVTAEDITRFSDTKVDKTTLNIVPILRHLKRLKEFRTGGSVYYLPY